MNTPSTGGLKSDQDTKKRAVNQIRTVIGHAQGIESMITEDRYCIDVLKQIAAVQASLSKVAHIISENHMKHCIVAAVEQGKGDTKIKELMETLKYLKHF